MNSPNDRGARAVWNAQPTDPLSSADRIERQAIRARHRALWNRCLIVAVALGTASWGVFEVLQGASLLAKVMGSLPFFLIATMSLREFMRYHARAAQHSASTTEFLRSELVRSRDEYLWFASWRGYTLVLGAMWLMVGTRIVAHGHALAFERRGFEEGMLFAILVPIVLSAVVFFLWRTVLVRSAAMRQAELEHLEPGWSQPE